PTERQAQPASPEQIRSGGGFLSSGKNILSLVLPIGVIFLAWELMARFSDVPQALLPPISDIVAAIVDQAQRGFLLADISGTLIRLFKSVFIGIAAGTVLGILMGYFKIWERMLAAPL